MHDISAGLDFHPSIARIPASRDQTEATAIGCDLDMVAARHSSEHETVAHDVAPACNAPSPIAIDVYFKGAMPCIGVVDINRAAAADRADPIHIRFLHFVMLGYDEFVRQL